MHRRRYNETPPPRLTRRPSIAPRPGGRAEVVIGLVLLAWLALPGCASYTDRVRQAQDAIVSGEAEAAINVFNEQLEVEELDEQPLDLNGEKALFLLERATLLQALGHYESSSRDMITVDDRMEWVDLKGDTAQSVMRFIYSDDVGAYRAPPHERLLLNMWNMINFMALPDLSGARVEARRFNILQTYFLDDSSRELIPNVLGLGNYLAGAAFEASQDYRTAVRYYTLAFLYGVWAEPDYDRLLDLIALTGYSGSGLGELRPQADDLLEAARQRPSINGSTYRQRYGQGDTLVVVQTGLVPYRKAQRIPLDQAVSLANRSPYAPIYMDTGSREQALALHASGTIAWLNTTELTRDGLPPANRTVALRVDNRIRQLTDPVDLGNQVEQAWLLVAGTALAAGISRAVVRAIAGEATRQITKTIAEQSGSVSPFAGLIGWLSGLIVQGTMAAADTPDTRSWSTLPSQVYLVRTKLDPGPQTVEVQVGNRTDSREVDIQSRRFHLLNFSRIR